MAALAPPNIQIGGVKQKITYVINIQIGGVKQKITYVMNIQIGGMKDVQKKKES